MLLGKTHMVNSLLLLHGGLLYAGTYRYTKELEEGDVISPIKIMNYEINEPLHVIDYGLILGITLMVILLLLRMGNKQLLWTYFGLLVLQVVVLKILSENPYGFTTAILFILFTLGSVFPDIDSEKSTIGSYIKPISSAIPHRTITHTLWVVLVLFGLALYFHNIYVLVFAVGYTVHIIQDSFSRQGIAWLYPITGYTSYGSGAVMKKGRNNPILAYHTGQSTEQVIFIISILLHIGLFVWFFYVQ